MTGSKTKLTALPSQTTSLAIFSDGKSVQVGSTTLYSVPGNTETAVCNNHGLCDTFTGLCTCFADWSSSDGAGGPGPLGDCGYRYFDAATGGAPFAVQLNNVAVAGMPGVQGVQGAVSFGKEQYPGAVTPDERQKNLGPLDLRNFH
jgi:hypothetical protein